MFYSMCSDYEKLDRKVEKFLQYQSYFGARARENARIVHSVSQRLFLYNSVSSSKSGSAE